MNKNVNNCQSLFAVVEKLTTPHEQIGPKLLSTEKFNEFRCFFNGKRDEAKY